MTSTSSVDSHLIPIRRALVSVFDKTGLEAVCAALAAHGVEILSTGGTAKALRAADIPVTDVSHYTGSPEILGGRVKSLHPRIHGGLLARRNLESDLNDLANEEIGTIDCVIVNLYPFAETIACNSNIADCIEMIDIGGPSMLRSAAKAHDWVTVVSDPADYDDFLRAFEAGDGMTSLEMRRAYAAKAFETTAIYDRTVADWFAQQCQDRPHQGDVPEAASDTTSAPPLPTTLSLSLPQVQSLRYGENPHQRGALYRISADVGAANARQLQGKPLSYNNVMDADAAYSLVTEFSEPTVAIIKHANPCGVAAAPSLEVAWDRALATDPISAFGGVVACNMPLDAATAEKISDLFLEVLIAPEFSPDALDCLSKKKNARLLEATTSETALPISQMPDPSQLHFRAVAGGLLVQDKNTAASKADQFNCVTRVCPDADQLRDLQFGERIVKHLASNAVVFVRDGAMLAAGAGQTSRLDACKIAISKAEALGIDLKGSCLASDAFFPFPDGVSLAIEAGAKAIVQPGGSMRDEDVIHAVDHAGAAMVFTGLRHFRH